MHSLRRYLAWPSRNALSRLSYPRLLALLLVVIVPGGLVVPLCAGLYGALRLTFCSKSANRIDPLAPPAVVEPRDR